MSRHHHAMRGRCNFGGGEGEARPDEKMSRRRRDQWPYFNIGWIEPKPLVSTAMRRTLKRVATKKRRQRDRP